ncbi:MAG: hypothetical protein AAGA77_16970 [Bacteroidota bacterium]
MINLNHLKIFEKYNGDSDGFARAGSKIEKEQMDHNYWFMIANFKHDLELVRKGLTSDGFNKDLERRLNEQVDVEAQERLKEAKKNERNILIAIFHRIKAWVTRY